MADSLPIRLMQAFGATYKQVSQAQKVHATHAATPAGVRG